MSLSGRRSPSPLGNTNRSSGARRSGAVRWGTAAGLGAGMIAVVLAGVLAIGTTAYAAQPRVGLGTAEPFAILAGTTVTNTGPTRISGDLGVHPGSEVTGFPPGQVNNGTQHVADAVALQAKNDLVTGFNDAASRTPAKAAGDLGGRTLAPGVYKSATALSLTGTVTLDAKGDPDAVFIFQAGSTLLTAPGSTVALIGQASPCNVFWQVGSSATLGTGTTFVGTIMARTTATLESATTVEGRVMARNGAVNLNANIVNAPDCAAPAPTPTATPTPTPTTTPTVPVVPEDNPGTGLGGAAERPNTLFLLGGLAAGGAVLASATAIRRPRKGRHGTQ